MQNDFEIKLLRKVRAKPAVVLLAKHINKVCSVPLLINDVNYA